MATDEVDRDTDRVIDDTGDLSAPSLTIRGFGVRYARGALIGVGGMGEVRAFTDRASGREVAVKTIRLGQPEQIADQRFAREARIQAQLEHPSIVPVYDLGLDDDGRFYFTMKRVRGHSLSRVLATMWDRRDAAPAYSLRKLLTVVARVAMTLEYAHRRGVINRDLKPSNIMLGAFDEVYVIDWGLALLRDPSAPPTASKPDLVLGLPVPADGLHGPLVDSSQRPETSPGQMIGTAGYVAPEQIQTPDLVDRRADVYALGSILFEVLAGQRLHVGETLADVLMSTLQLDGANPASRAPERAVPPELDALCRWATRLDPDQRPPSAEVVARAIEDYLDGDRDLERRRQLARKSASAATAALVAAHADPTGGSAHRALAMREIGRALALDPDNVAARVTLVRALTEPGPTVPEADAAHRITRVRSYQLAARTATLALLSYALYLPLVLWMGLRHAWMLGAVAASILAVVGLTYHYYRRPPADLGLPWPHLVASTIALLWGSVLFGPLVLLPALVIVNGVAYIGVVGRRSILYLVAAIAVVVVPLALQLADVLPRSYAFTDGEIRILPQMTYFPPTATLVFLVVTNVVVIAGSLLYVWRMRCNHLDVERRLQLQAWQLAQLVPAAGDPDLVLHSRS